MSLKLDSKVRFDGTSTASLDSQFNEAISNLYKVIDDVEELKASLYDTKTDEYVLRNAHWTLLDRINLKVDSAIDVFAKVYDQLKTSQQGI